MDKLPYELVYSIINHLDSPKDICSISQVSSLFYTVAHDDRIWKHLCYKLYNIKPRLDQMQQSFYDLFTKTLVPYGRYLGYWKSNTKHYGGFINVHLDLSTGVIIGEKYNIRNTIANIAHLFFDEDEDDDEDGEEEEEETFLKPVYQPTKIFTIDSNSHEIYCYECNKSHEKLPWINTLHLNEKYFGLSQELLPIDQRSLLISHDHHFMDNPEDPDVFFLKNCSENVSIVYHPVSIPHPIITENAHPLARLNGIWVGTYGGHGLELLYLKYLSEFTCPPTVDGRPRETQIVSNVLVASKITGDPNVPHSQISFAAVFPIEEGESTSPVCYEGIGQIAGTNYRDAQFIRTKVIPVSENLIKVTWYALHHTSFFKRCPF